LRLHPSILCLLVLLPVSCASDSGKEKAPAPPEHKSLTQRLDESNGYKQDEKGNWLPKSDKRSQFESQGQSPYFSGEFGKKDYKTTTFSNRSWWGNKNYGAKEYAGNTDGSRFQKSSALDGKGAREAGQSAGASKTYGTNKYATTTAREAGSKTIDKPSDAETDNRRKVYPAPEIIDWREQRSLSLEQSKGILGH
jgi:hypothetical protein